MRVLETASVTSADGTRICYRTLGEGPALVIVHGSFSTSDDYVPVAVRLATTHRVVLVDRRGYRESGVGPTPAMFMQDAEDLAAVLATFGQPGLVFGHSTGALVALHAGIVAPASVKALALYEPPVLFGGPERQPLLDRFHELRALGKDAEALVAYTSATNAVAEDVVRLWIEGPVQHARVQAVVAGVGRDLEAAVALNAALRPWRNVTAPVTLLLSAAGDDSSATGAHGLSEVLPSVRALSMDSPEHLVHLLDPDVFAGAIRTAFAD